MKIYTRKGDDGTTSLWYGGRVAKSDARTEAYGSLDEAASALGVARSLATDAAAARATSCTSRTTCSSRAPSSPPPPRRAGGWRPA